MARTSWKTPFPKKTTLQNGFTSNRKWFPNCSQHSQEWQWCHITSSASLDPWYSHHILYWLVVWNMFYFSIYWESSSQLIFFRGVGIPPTRYILYRYVLLLVARYHNICWLFGGERLVAFWCLLVEHVFGESGSKLWYIVNTKTWRGNHCSVWGPICPLWCVQLRSCDPNKVP